MISPMPTESEIRAKLDRLAKSRGSSLAALSRMIGRNPAYLQQFVQRGTPRRLDEDDRLTLAQFFGVNEREFGARDPWSPDGAPTTQIRQSA
jgi:hypothetical protein